MADKSHHHFFQFALRHLAVTHKHTRLRHHLLNLGSNFIDGFHAIVDKVGLTAAFKFVLKSGLDQLFVEGGNHSLDCHAVLGRSLNHAHVAQSNHGHVQGPRNWRGGHGEHVHLFLQLLEPLFVTDAETLLLVDNHKPKVLEFNVFGQNAVRADYDVNFALFNAFRNFFLLPGGAEAAHHLYVDGEGRKPPLEVFVMLEDQDGGRRKHCDLLVILDCLERGTHGDFSLAIADIATEQTVHGQRRLHVLLDFFGGLKLVFGLVEFEGVFKFALPLRVRRKSMPCRSFTLGVELEQFVGHIFHGLLHARLGLGPGSAAQTAQRRPHAFTGTIFLDQIQARERDVKLCALSKFEQHEFAGDLTLLDLLQALVHADAVLHVHDEVANGEIAEVGHESGGLRLLPQGLRNDYFGFIKEVTRAE